MLYMKRLAITIISVFLLFFSFVPRAYAADSCADLYGITSVQGLGVSFPSGSKTIHNISFNIGTANPGDTYYAKVTTGYSAALEQTAKEQPNNSQLSFSFTSEWALNDVVDGNQAQSTSRTVSLYKSQPGFDDKLCELGSYTVERAEVGRTCSQIVIFQIRNGQECYGGSQSRGCIDESDKLRVQALGVSEDGQPFDGNVKIKVVKDGLDYGKDIGPVSLDESGNTGTILYDNPGEGSYDFIVQTPKAGLNFCSTSLNITGQCTEDTMCDTDQPPPPDIPPPLGSDEYIICDQIDSTLTGPTGGNLREQCEKCVEGNGRENNGIWTAIGCIQREPAQIAQALIIAGLMMGGGVGLLMILAGAFILTTSGGDPKRVSEAKEMITAAIIGLLFIIFSVTILQFVGTSVFQIPGFGSASLGDAP